MKNLLARLALLGSIAAFVAVASSAFAQDKPPAPGAEATPAATAPAAPAAAPAAAPKCGDKGFDCNKGDVAWIDRKSTRLNSSHGYISYAVFCLKKKTKNRDPA